MFVKPEKSLLFQNEQSLSVIKNFSRTNKARPASSVQWRTDSDNVTDDYLGEEELEGEEAEFCGHKGCSFVYNVHESCLQRPSFIMESVPHDTYLKLAPIFGMDPKKKFRSDGSNRCKVGPMEEEDKEVEEFIHLIETELGIKSGESMDGQVEVGTYRNSIRDDPTLLGTVTENPYLNFLKRTSEAAEVATNRFTLAKRSKEITKVIIRNFLEWFRSIGGAESETTIDENILQDLFQIGFDSPTAKAIALRIKEMPVVPDSLATITDEQEFAVKKGLKTLLKMDVRLEQQPAKLFAFGTMVPKERPSLRFQPPKNQVKKNWTKCQRVPQDLESMKVVWGGIENLRSTIAFSNWLKQHPEIKPPRYLKEKGLLDVNYEEWMQIFKGFEKDIDSEGADIETRQKEMGEEPGYKVMKMDDYMENPSSYSLNWKA